MTALGIYTPVGAFRTFKPNQRRVERDAVFFQTFDLFVTAQGHKEKHGAKHPPVRQLNFEQRKKQIDGIEQIGNISGSREKNAVDPPKPRGQFGWRR